MEFMFTAKRVVFMVKVMTVGLIIAGATSGRASFEVPATLIAHDGAKLTARWTIPDGEIRAVYVILPGSGNVGLDGDVSSPIIGRGHNGVPARLSEQVAGVLANQGVATLRYAKRGVDDASEQKNQTMAFLTKDASSALDMVHQSYPGKKYGFVGFSEGALVAVMVAGERKVDALFLLGMATRSIDDILGYQFTQWPVELARKLDRDGDGELSAEELSILGETGSLPLLNPDLSGAPWRILDSNDDKSLSVANEIIPAYQRVHAYVMQAMRTPAYATWYQGMKSVPSFAELASKVTAPVFLYHAIDDAQVYWGWSATDKVWFAGSVESRLFSRLGHCFAPMEGPIGQDKTSGPFDSSLLSTLAEDVRKTL